MKMRQGTHRRKNIYVQLGDKPEKTDPWVALCETEEVAELICRWMGAEEVLSKLPYDSRQGTGF